MAMRHRVARFPEVLKYFRRERSTRDILEEFGVSYSTARRRIKQLLKEGRIRETRPFKRMFPPLPALYKYKRKEPTEEELLLFLSRERTIREVAERFVIGPRRASILVRTLVDKELVRRTRAPRPGVTALYKTYSDKEKERIEELKREIERLEEEIESTRVRIKETQTLHRSYAESRTKAEADLRVLGEQIEKDTQNRVFEIVAYAVWWSKGGGKRGRPYDTRREVRVYGWCTREDFDEVAQVLRDTLKEILESRYPNYEEYHGIEYDTVGVTGKSEFLTDGEYLSEKGFDRVTPDEGSYAWRDGEPSNTQTRMASTYPWEIVRGQLTPETPEQPDKVIPRELETQRNNLETRVTRLDGEIDTIEDRLEDFNKDIDNYTAALNRLKEELRRLEGE